MSLTGGYAEQQGIGVRIDTQGTGAGDGWSLVMLFPDSALPAGTNREGCFVVSGMLGQSAVGNALNARLEVGLRIAGEPTPRKVTHVAAVNGQTRDNRPLRGIPFSFVLMFQSGGLGNYIGGSSSLEIVARVYRNGDPSSITSAFWVTSCRMLFWDLDRLGAGNYFFHDYVTITANINRFSQGFGTVTTTAAFPFTSFGEKWLVWSNVEFRPGSLLTAPTLKYEIDDGTATLKSHHTAGGLRRSTASHRDQISLGGSRILSVSNNATGIALRGRDGHDVPADTTTVHGAQWFAVRLNALARWLELEHPAAPNIFNDADVPTRTALSWEPLMPGVHGGLMFASYMRKGAGGSQTDRSWQPHVWFGTVRSIYSSNLHCVGDFPLIYETLGAMGLGTLPVLNRQDPRVFQFANGNPLETQYATSYPVEDQSIVAWHFEDDASVFQVSSRPPPPPTVVVVPGREGADISALTEIPVQPLRDFSFSDDPGEHEHELQSDMAYRVTWPKFATRRYRADMPFVLTDDERNTLVDFIEGLAGRVFRWTPPELGASAIALRVVGDITASEVSVNQAADRPSIWRVTVPVVQLTWLTEAP